jgi:hypothetical protein
MNVETREEVLLNRLTHELAIGVVRMVHMFGESWMRLYAHRKVITYVDVIGEGITVDL